MPLTSLLTPFQFLAFMLISHNIEAAHSHGRTPWILVTFWSMMALKMVLLCFIVSQIRCARQGREGRLDCCWNLVCATHSGQRANTEEEPGELFTRTRSGSSHSVLLKRYASRDHEHLWRSELRARDIQLILRFASIMPTWSISISATPEDVIHVEIAKSILGSGGMTTGDGASVQVTDTMMSMMSSETDVINPIVEHLAGANEEDSAAIRDTKPTRHSSLLKQDRAILNKHFAELVADQQARQSSGRWKATQQLHHHEACTLGDGDCSAQSFSFSAGSMVSGRGRDSMGSASSPRVDL